MSMWSNKLKSITLIFLKMAKRIKRIIITRTIVYDRVVFDQKQGITDDEQFVRWVNDVADDDFKYPSNFTEDFSLQQTQWAFI